VRFKPLILTMVMLTVLLLPGSARAICSTDGGAILETITNICWECIFPIKMAGFDIIPGNSDNDFLDMDSETVCVCPKADCYPCFTGIGVTLSYWPQNRVSETVSDPWCFPYYGIDLASMNDGTLLGTSSAPAVNTGGRTSGHGFAQAHWWKNEIWAELISEIAGAMCDAGGEDEDSGWDIGWFTELDPLWNDDELQAILEPEALLFANPLSQLACIPQAISSIIGWDMPLLFWCIGGGSAYPMTGAINNPDFTEANERVAARSIYRMTRLTLLCDTAIDACKCTTFPIWWESHYRIQEVKPVQDYTCQTLGRTSAIWGYMKNPPGLSDNFVWLIYRKSMCCFMMECLC